MVTTMMMMIMKVEVRHVGGVPVRVAMVIGTEAGTG